jgi:hypothetical protein
MAFGIRRKTGREVDLGPVATKKDLPTTDTGKAFQQGLRNFTSGLTATRGVANILTGDEKTGVEQLREAEAVQREAAQQGPAVQRLEDINGASDAFDFAANQMAMQIPNLATALVPGTIGAKIGERVVKGGVRRQVMKRIEQGEFADQVQKEFGKNTATASVEADQMQDAARTVAKRVAAKEVAPGALARGSGIGAGIGGAAGGTQMELGQLAPEVVLDPNGTGTVLERTQKAIIGAAAAGSLEALPTVMLLKRAGLAKSAAPEITRTVGQVASRMVREGGKQALTEGGTEAAQTVIERATKRWVNQNIQMLSPEAFHEYLNAAVAGAVTGGPLGAVTAFQLPSGNAKPVPKSDGGNGNGGTENDVPLKNKESVDAAFNRAFEGLDTNEFDTKEFFDLEGDANEVEDEAGVAYARNVARETFGEDQAVEGPEEAPFDYQSAAVDADVDRARFIQGRVFRLLKEDIDDAGIEVMRKAFSGTPVKNPESLTNVTQKRESLSKEEVEKLREIETELKGKWGARWPQVLQRLQQYTQGHGGNREFNAAKQDDVKRKQEDYAAGVVNVNLRGKAAKDVVVYPQKLKDNALTSLIRSGRDLGIEGAEAFLAEAEKSGKFNLKAMPPKLRAFIEQRAERVAGRPVNGIADLTKVHVSEMTKPPAGFIQAQREDGTKVWVNLDKAVRLASEGGVTTDEDGNVSGERLPVGEALAEAYASLAEQGITLPELSRDQIVRMELNDPKDPSKGRKVTTVRDLEAKYSGKPEDTEFEYTGDDGQADAEGIRDNSYVDSTADAAAGGTVFDGGTGSLPPKEAKGQKTHEIKKRMGQLRADASLKKLFQQARDYLSGDNYTPSDSQVEDEVYEALTRMYQKKTDVPMDKAPKFKATNYTRQWSLTPEQIEYMNLQTELRGRKGATNPAYSKSLDELSEQAKKPVSSTSTLTRNSRASSRSRRSSTRSGTSCFVRNSRTRRKAYRTRS